MDKELFIKTIEAIKKQYAYDQVCSEAFQVILPNDFISSYDNHYLTNALLEVLKVAMNDNIRHSWVEYFIYDLDFGRDYKEGCATNEDGSNIDLSSSEKLWEFLRLNYG